MAARLQVLGNVHILQEVCVVIVFFISGITLQTDDMARALRYRLELAYGMVTILFTTSLLGFAFRGLPLSPPEFATGARPTRPPSGRPVAGCLHAG